MSRLEAATHKAYLGDGFSQNVRLQELPGIRQLVSKDRSFQ
jgi:hypothetical protein